MSHTHRDLTAAPSSNFQLRINDALNEYKKRTKKDLLAHPLAVQLSTCDTPSAILAVLQEQVQQVDQSRSSDERWTKWLDPTVNVLYAFSSVLGAGVGLVYPPTTVVFAGVGVLLSAAKDVRASQETILDIFERIEMFFRRLEVYVEVEPSTEMMDTIIQIMVEILSILGTATKEIKQGRMKKYVKKLLGRTDVEDALKKLDKLTHEEARMAIAQNLKATHAVGKSVKEVVDKVVTIDNRVARVDDRVASMDDRVASVDNRVARVDDRVARVGDGVTSVDNTVKGVDTRMARVDDRVKAVDDRVAEIVHDGKEAKVAIQQTATDVDQVKRKQLRDSVHKWLSPPDPSTNHNIACGTHHKKTASWFFQGSIFQEWKSTGSLLWIHGKPGSGKSVLCSTVIQDIETMCKAGNASMAYFYFDFRDANKQGLRDLVLSLLTQLSTHSGPRCNILSNLYLTHDEGKNQPSDTILAEHLKEMLALPDERPIYLIIDALDESPNTSGIPSPRERVLQLVKELVELRLPNLRICVTSRPETDIRDVLEPLTSRRVSLHDQSGQKKDIVEYVKSVVYSNSETIMRRWRTEDKELVVKVLSERADGMFRWVFCQLEVLRGCLPPSVRHTLDGLPESLDKTYERILNEIKKPNRDHALRLLQCLVVAIRPLRAEELAEVLAVDFDDAEGVPKLNTNWRWEDQEQALLSSCSSLITIVESDESRIVQFSHFSVKEFLTSARLATSSGDVSRFHVVLEPAHTILAQACMSVLLRLDVPIEEGDVENSSPLARYAAGHWVAHAKYEKVSSYLRKAMETLFDPHRPYYAAWLHLHDIDTPPVTGSTFNQFASTWRPESGAQSGVTPLYYAALCGFQDLVEHLVVNNPNYVNARGGYYVSPLVAALAGSYFQTAKFLRDNGADPNLMSRNKNTPLHSAAFHGDSEMIQLLLKYEADVNARGVNGKTALHFVIHGPNMAGPNIDLSLSNIVRLLLEHGADPNAMDIDRFTPLHVAAQYGRVGAVRVLLEHSAKANVGSQAGDRTTIFQAASEFVNSPEAEDRTALHLVSYCRHYAVTNIELSVSNVARLLLEHGANLNARDNTYFTPLHSAARHGRVEVARLLLEHGANVGAEDEDGRTASDVAEGGRRNEIMQLLSEYRAR